MSSYVKHKHYATDFGDMVPVILLRALALNINILDTDRRGLVNKTEITPMKPSPDAL